MSYLNAPQLQAVFQELDYLDDGYQDGIVSHVGLRRIVLETPELEAEIGSTFTRALLSRCEQNLYGRLSFEDFVILAREIEQYATARSRYMSNKMNNSSIGYSGSLNSNRVDPRLVETVPVNPYYYNGRQHNPYRHHHKKGTRHQAHLTAAAIAIPKSERDERISYLDQYSCKPPPLFMILLTAAQIGVFVWHAIILTGQGRSIGPNGPPYLGVLIFNPHKKHEVWRYASYMFVHSGYFHIAFNCLMQLLLGVPLEMVHRWWRILLIYICGVIAGSLATSVTDPGVYLAGASGGVYALITAHLANVIFNWSEMELPFLRLLAFIILTGADTAVAVYYYFFGVDTRVSYVAHIAGAVAGLLLGVVVLRNLRVRTWERVLWWICLLLFLGLFLAGVVFNVIDIVRPK